MLGKLKSAALVLLGGVVMVLQFMNARHKRKIDKREIDDLKIEANAMQVIVDDKEAEEGIRNAENSRSSNLNHFE